MAARKRPPSALRVRPPPAATLEARQLNARYRALFVLWRDRVEGILRRELRHDARADAADADLERAWDSLFGAAGLDPTLRRTARNTSARSRAYTEKTLQRPVGWSVGEQEAVERFRQENLRLVTGLGRDQRVRLARVFRLAQAAGMRWEEIVPDVMRAIGVGERRARLIARDQTASLNGQLARAHQKAAGVSQYVWRTTRLPSVRGKPDGLYPDSESNHWALEGTVQSWDNPPITNPATGERHHPGEDIQCMCTAEPLLPALAIPEPQPRTRTAGTTGAGRKRSRA